MIRLLILSLAALLFFTDPAAADPISGLIAAGKAFFATKLGAIVAQVAISSGLSLLAQRLRKKPKQPGLQNQFKGRGGTEPGSFVLGRAAVKGHQTYHNSQGENSKWYHEVIELCDLPGATLERLIIDGQYSDIGDVYVDDSAGNVGNIIVAKNKDSDSHRAFIRTYDGTQTAADALLVSHFAENDRRWTSDHKLTGICYAVLSYYFDRKRFSRGVPELSFEMLGIPVYDPRKDTSVGGSGAHRWADPSTWEQSENLIVLVYNILRGIAAPGGAVWGGDCEHEDLPMANWVAAMNACDIDVDGRKKYTGGIEVRWTDEPRDIIDQLLAGCNGQITELGGVYRVQVDAPATAVVSVTDNDFIVSDPSEMDPFPGFEGTFNGGTVVHPDPAQLWNASQPHTVTNPSLETQDGTQRLFDLQLPVVHNTAQAKQVLNAAVKDGRQFRKHKGTLPPDLFWLDTLSTFAWTSESEGYTAKLFEIAETAYDLLTFNTVRSIRERDPSDFPIVPGLELPATPGVTVPIIRVDAGVTGFDFEPVIITVEDGPQRPAFRLSWNAEALEGNIAGIAYELRLVGGDVNAKSGSTTDIAAGSLILSGDIIPDALYEARPKALSSTRDTDWDNWVQARAPNVGIGADDFWAAIDAQVQEASERLGGAIDAAIAREIDVAVTREIDNALEFDIDDILTGFLDKTRIEGELTESGARFDDEITRIREGQDSSIVDVLAEFDISDLAGAFLDKAEVEGEIERVNETLQTSIDDVVATIETEYVTGVFLDGAIATLTNTVNAQIDDVEADITQISTAIATTDQSLAQFEQTISARVGDVEANVTQVSTAIATTDSALSQFQVSVNSKIGDIEADVTQVSTAIATTDSALSQFQVSVNSKIGDVLADVTQVSTSLAATNQAIASYQQSVTAQFDDVIADITQTATAVSNAVSAQAQLETTLSSQIDGVEAYVNQQFYTKVEADGAISDAVTTVETSLNGLSTSVLQVQSSVDGIEGVYGVKINNNGAVAGFGLISTLRDGGAVSDFILEADNVYFRTPGSLASPFVLTGGTVYLRKAMIKEADIGTLELAGNAATAGSFAESTTLRIGRGLGVNQHYAVTGGAITVPAHVTAKIMVSVGYQQGYLAQPTQWGFRLRRVLPLQATLLHRVGMVATNDYPTVTYLDTLTNTAGAPVTCFFAADWFGENADIELQRVTISILAAWR